MITTPAQALALLRRQKALTLTPAPGVRSLVEEVVGGPIAGSWWGHPQGGVIYKLATALEDSPDTLVAKLVDGKVTFVHRALWPALVRVVTDPDWRRASERHLSAAARRLLAEVEKIGEHRGAVDRKARAELEKRALVVSASEHTERGSHAVVLRSWRAWAAPDVVAEAAALSVDEARERLRRAGIAWE